MRTRTHTMTPLLAAASALLVLGLSACQGEQTQGAPAPDPPPQQEPSPEPSPEPEPVDEATLLEPGVDEDSLREHARVHEEGSGPIASAPTEQIRHRRRLDLPQLDASIRKVTGGIGWTEERGGRTINLFEDLSQTLGEPDYLDSTDVDLEPSLIFQKFLGDAARDVCDKLAAHEQVTHFTPGEPRHLFIEASPTQTLEGAPARIDANLRALLLRFHGTYVPEGQPEHPALVRWRWLYRSAEHTAQDPVTAWRTVCVGLITHPDFYTY